MEFDSKYDFAPPTTLLGLLLYPWMWDIFFFGGIQHSPVNDCSALTCNFVVIAEDEHTSFYSTILWGTSMMYGYRKKINYFYTQRS